MAANDEQDKSEQDEDAGLTREELQFKKLHPETWKQMQEEKRQQQEGRP